MNTTYIERSNTNNLTLVTDYDYKLTPKKNTVYAVVITFTCYQYFETFKIFATEREALDYVNFVKTVNNVEEIDDEDYNFLITKHEY